MFCISPAWSTGHNVYRVSRKYGNMRKILYVQNYLQNLFNIFIPYLETFLMVQNTWQKDSHTCPTCLLKWREIEYSKVMFWDMSLQKADDDAV